MAEVVVIGEQQFKKRRPWGVWGLALVTLGVYYFVWYYKINDEARRYLRDDSIKPVLSLLALFVPIVNYVSIWRTGERIVRMEDRADTRGRLEPVLALLATFVIALHLVYMQSHLNGVWDSATAAPSTPEVPGASA